MACCTDERNGKFPFDIQHRSVLTYKAGSKSDFENLEQKLVERINAYLGKAKIVEMIDKAPIKDLDGLSSHEIAILIILMSHQLVPDDDMSVYTLSQEMVKIGYTKIAVSVGLRMLASKKMIEMLTSYDQYAQTNYSACKLLNAGDEWVLNNQHLITFKSN